MNINGPVLLPFSIRSGWKFTSEETFTCLAYLDSQAHHVGRSLKYYHRLHLISISGLCPRTLTSCPLRPWASSVVDLLILTSYSSLKFVSKSHSTCTQNWHSVMKQPQPQYLQLLAPRPTEPCGWQSALQLLTLRSTSDTENRARSHMK